MGPRHSAVAALACALLLGATAGTERASAAARTATCDQVAGATVALSDGWRLFWPDRWTPAATASKDRPLLACERSSKPLTRARYLGYNAKPDRIGLVPHLIGDAVQIDRTDPDGGPTIEGSPVQLRAGTWRRVRFSVPVLRGTTSTTIDTNGWSSLSLTAKFSALGSETALTLVSEHVPRVNDDSHHFPVAALALGSSDEVRVLATATTAFVLAVARWADAPNELRVRAYRVGEARPVVDLPESAALRGTGHAIVTPDGTVALAAPDQIRIWENGLRGNGFYGYVERSVPATNPTNLAIDELPLAGDPQQLTYTDTAGAHTTPLL